MALFDLLKFIPIVSEAFKSKDYYKPANRAVNASLDPNSAQFQNLYQAERQMGQNDLAFQIAELQRQNRKNSQMGRTPLFSPERGGETIFRGLMEGQLQAGDQARRTTYDALGQGAGNLMKMGQQNQMAGLYKAAGIGSIADAFRPKSEEEYQLEAIKKIFNIGQ